MTYEELLVKNQQLSKELSKTNAELSNTKMRLTDAEKELSNTKVILANKELELNNLKRIIFGSKREKTPKGEQTVDSEQCSLFDNEEDIERNTQEQIAEQVEEITIHKKKKAKKKISGIKKSFLKDIVIKRQEYVLNEEEKCPHCDSEAKLVGKKVVHQEICYTPPTIEIKEYVQCIYKCTKCGTEGSEKETPTFMRAEIPKPLLTHSFVSPSLATEVFYQKYYLGVPFYRQEKMWDDRRSSITERYDGKLEYKDK